MADDPKVTGADPNEPNPTPTSDPQPKPEGEKKYTQEEADRFAGFARFDERKKFADYDQLKKDTEIGKQLKHEQMSEQERLQTDLAEAQKKTVDADARIADAMITAAIQTKAAVLGSVDPEAVVHLIDRTGVSFSEEEGVKGVDEALTSLMESKPYLKGERPRAPNLNGGKGDPAPAVTVLTADQKKTAEVQGLSEEDYAKGLPTPSA